MLSVRLVAWVARQALPHTVDRASSEAAILAAKAWADCPCDTHTRAAAAAADIANRVDSGDAATAAAGAASLVGHVTELLTHEVAVVL